MKKNQEKYLNTLVASYGVFYTKLHQHHWYVKGLKFFEAHAKFEEFYNEITENLDEVAERVLQLGGQPVATLKEFLELSLIEEAPFKDNEDTVAMVKSVVADFETLNKTYQEGYDLFEGDEVTLDLLVGLQAAVQKHLWMLNAYLA